MNVLGMSPLTPLMILATTHRIDAVRALLDAGARVDETDDDGITVLSWAAIANRVGMARLLIERRGRCESRRQERHDPTALRGFGRLWRTSDDRPAAPVRRTGERPQ